MSYGFYVAKVVGKATVDDNRLQVKVLPQMEGIKDSECPCWPSFFKDSLYTGPEGEYVWVICDDEFSLGYVFGPANYNTYPDRTKMDGASIYKTSEDGISLSIPEDLRSAISDSYMATDGYALELGDAKVTYWNDSCIHFTERSTGGSVIAFKSGTLYIFRSDECLIKVGGSVIKLTSKALELNGLKVQIQSDYVGLGNNSFRNVLVTEGTSADGSVPSQSVFA